VLTIISANEGIAILVFELPIDVLLYSPKVSTNPMQPGGIAEMGIQGIACLGYDLKNTSGNRKREIRDQQYTSVASIAMFMYPSKQARMPAPRRYCLDAALMA